MSAKEVIKKAEEQNIKLTEGYVYNIRASLKKKDSKKAFGLTAPTLAKAKVKARHKLHKLREIARDAQAKRQGYDFSRGEDLSGRIDIIFDVNSMAQANFFKALDAMIEDRVRHIMASLASGVK